MPYSGPHERGSSPGEEVHQLAEVVAWMEFESKKCQILDFKDSWADVTQDGNNGWQILVRMADEVLLSLAGIEPWWEGSVCSRHTVFEMSY